MPLKIKPMSSTPQTTASPTSAKPAKSIKALLAPLRNAWDARFQPFWQARVPRERLILSGGAVALAIILLYLLVWEPAQTQRSRLEKSLPTLRSQTVEMQSMAQEARALGGLKKTSLRGNALQDAVQASLASKGLKATKLTVQSGSGDQAGDTVQLQLSNVNFGQWADWLDDARRQQQLKVVDAQIQYIGAPALVNVQASLQGAKP